MTQKTRVVLRRLRKLTATFQAELRGHYSVGRMYNFLHFSQTASPLWAIVVCVVSPFPCILVLTLIDCAPMAPPAKGSRANYLFWCRDILTIALMTRVILEQFRISIPELRMSTFQLVIMPTISSGGAVAFMIAMSSVIGFPLPFALVVGISVWFIVLVACFVVFFGRILKQDRELLKDLLRSIVVLICQVLLTFVYPTYLYGFVSVKPSNQKFYVMLLPVFKIIAKNWIGYCLGDKFDLTPQIMIFNVDVFNALYVSSSMQNSQSLTTMFQMVALDALLGWVSITDIRDLMKPIVSLKHKIPAGHPLKSASFLEIAIQLIENDPQAKEHLVLHRRGSVLNYVRRLSSVRTISVGGPLPTEEMSTSRRIHPVDSTTCSIPTAESPDRKPSLEHISTKPSLDGIFSAKESQKFIRYSARVLYTTEFVILVEYTEVIVPFIYSMYTTTMFYLPNHDYYPQIQSFDAARLADKLGRLVAYGFIELLSLLVIGYFIQRMLRISMLQILVFVLDPSWRMVQSNLFLWICYTIQNSLEHNGADFSFKFSWLKSSTSH